MAFQKGNKLGTGRPKGSMRKVTISDYMSDADFQKIIEKAIKMALKGNEAMIKFVGDHRLGKPAQNVDMTSGGEKINFVIAHEIAQKNGFDSMAETSSK